MAGLATDFQLNQAFRLPEANSLASYYLAVPDNADRLDAHFKAADEQIDMLPATVRYVLRQGGAREMLLRTNRNRPDNALMAVLLGIFEEEEPIPVAQAIRG
jgi:hypothetical protein